MDARNLMGRGTGMGFLLLREFAWVGHAVAFDLVEILRRFLPLFQFCFIPDSVKSGKLDTLRFVLGGDLSPVRRNNTS